jgi:hemolysin type calcium-binding protein/uncharacterized protein DUF11/WD40 repeat protein
VKRVGQADNVWLMRPDGSNQRQITSDGGQKASLGWQPNGARLVYAEAGGVFTLVEGNPPVRIATGGEPVWSPDGSRIAYSAQDGIWTTGPDGQSPVRVTAIQPAYSPAWSYDGARIVFVGTRIYPELASKFGAPARQDVYTIRADGTDLLRLTGPRDIETYSAFPPGGSVPTWWPDGSRLFFESERASGFATTYVMNPDGTCEGQFASTQNALRRPSWRPGSHPGLGPIRCADLRIRAVSTGGYVNPTALGQESPFQLEIDNDGNETATDVRVEVKTTANIELLDGNGGVFPCSGGTRDRVCSLPPLSPTSVVSVNFRVRSAVAGIFPFSLSVGALEPDTDPTNNTLPLSTQVLPCDKVGTYGSDVLYGTPERDRICALPGADHVYGNAGNDYLDSGNGNDIVVGGPGRDVILAKGGNDTIYARDGQRDVIDCGTERDVAIVDRLDVVKRCETVVRPR